MPDRYRVQVKVSSIMKGECPRGIKVGDAWLIENGETPGVMCSDAYISISPAIRLLWLGGEQPWDKDRDVTYRSCPDSEVMVVFEVRRLRPHSS